MSDLKTFQVQVVSVNDNAVIVGKKGPYSGLDFKYIQGGETKSKAIHSAFFEKKKALISALKSFSEGDTVEITVEGAPFYGLDSARRLDATSAAVPQSFRSTSEVTKPFAKSTFVDNSIGMQVGNALTNAATLIAGGAKGTLEEVAESVLFLGERLKARLVAGDFSPIAEKKSVPPQKATKKAAVVVEDADEDADDPFGDA